jgi:hypothetical protein
MPVYGKNLTHMRPALLFKDSGHMRFRERDRNQILSKIEINPKANNRVRSSDVTTTSLLMARSTALTLEGTSFQRQARKNNEYRPVCHTGALRANSSL